MILFERLKKWLAPMRWSLALMTLPASSDQSFRCLEHVADWMWLAALLAFAYQAHHRCPSPLWVCFEHLWTILKPSCQKVKEVVGGWGQSNEFAPRLLGCGTDPSANTQILRLKCSDHQAGLNLVKLSKQAFFWSRDATIWSHTAKSSQGVCKNIKWQYPTQGVIGFDMG